MKAAGVKAAGVNHLSPVWWLTFKIYVCELQLVCKFNIAQRYFLYVFPFIRVFIHHVSFAYDFSPYFSLK